MWELLLQGPILRTAGYASTSTQSAKEPIHTILDEVHPVSRVKVDICKIWPPIKDNDYFQLADHNDWHTH
jgi:hypothetical protein